MVSMAKIQYGLGVTNIRGTVGGATFSGNKGGGYVKPYARGPRSSVPGQNLTKVSVSYAGYIWGQMLPADRADWAAFAAAPPEIDHDSLGNVITLSGYSWMVRCVTRMISTVGVPSAYVGPATPLVAPLPFTLELYSLQLGLTQSWCHTNGADWVGGDVGVLFGALLNSQGILQAQRGWRMIYVNQDPGSADWDIGSGLQAAFGNVPAGWVLQARLYRQSAWGVRSPATEAVGTFGV